jgi:hypothetical protein
MRRRILIALVLALPCAAAAEDAPRYTSEATRRLAEERERQREAWWARERERQAARRFDREIERRRDATGPLIRRWEEQRERRRWR